MKELIGSGIELMFAGMGIVYIFLTMLVFAIDLMSAVVQRHFPDQSAKIGKPDGRIDKNTVAAISAAVHHYRQKHR